MMQLAGVACRIEGCPATGVPARGFRARAPALHGNAMREAKGGLRTAFQSLALHSARVVIRSAVRQMCGIPHLAAHRDEPRQHVLPTLGGRLHPD
eukprot:8280883-Pyramimonas_sp.AAC.1